MMQKVGSNVFDTIAHRPNTHRLTIHYELLLVWVRGVSLK